MFGLTFEKLFVIGVIAVFVLGPERLPHYAGQLGRFVRSIRDMANGAKDRVKDELGPEFNDIDWKKLDPREYDPRRIIRDALRDDTPGVADRNVAGTVTSTNSGESPEQFAPSGGLPEQFATMGGSPGQVAPKKVAHEKVGDDLAADRSMVETAPRSARAVDATPFDAEAT